VKKQLVNWEYIDNATSDLANKIKESGLNIISICGLPRGGLIPAVMLSHKLNIPLLKNRRDLATGRVLVVDDICDTGTTLKSYAHLPIATIHTKPTAIIQPTFYYEQVGVEWIVYPWENTNSKTIPDYKILNV